MRTGGCRIRRIDYVNRQRGMSLCRDRRGDSQFVKAKRYGFRNVDHRDGRTSQGLCVHKSKVTKNILRMNTYFKEAT